MKNIFSNKNGPLESMANGQNSARQAGFILPLVILLILLAGTAGAYLYTKKQISTSSDADRNADRLADILHEGDLTYADNRTGKPSDQPRLVSDYKPASTAGSESLCVNSVYKYQIAIPGGWKAWTTGHGEGRPATCTEGLATIILSDDFYGYNQSAKGMLSISVYPAPRSNSDENADQPAFEEEDFSMVGGKRLVWTTFNTNKSGSVVHNGYTYDFNASGKAVDMLPSLMASFRFLQ